MFEAMNWVDYTIIGILVVSTLLSLIRGFVREALSLVIWVLGFWVALTYSHALSEQLVEYIATPSIRLGVSFASLFIIVLFIGGFINFFLGQLVQKTGLSGTDRLLGIVFGIARGVLFVALLMLVGSFTKLPADPWWQQSQLMPYFQGITNWLKSVELSNYVSEKFAKATSESLLNAAMNPSVTTTTEKAVTNGNKAADNTAKKPIELPAPQNNSVNNSNNSN